LVNTRDHWHSVAVAWERRLAGSRRRLLTTELILVEIADGLAAVRFRQHAAQIIGALRSSALIEVVPSSLALLDSTLEVYRTRQDKDWGFTDRASFVVMGQRGLLEALTTDEHFRQAGFRPLLLEDAHA
jgi:uncharacterized protein